MARSVAELLPRRFEDLTLEDVEGILADHTGDERETLWLERKAEVSTSSLAKACSAFANTYGGLLVVGVNDDDDRLVGISPRAAEAQLWVKDTLRAHVLPMPAFRARWLDVDGTLGILIVLVEESSSTPHLLMRSGAIYVRNPGSSDPVPINDQGRLLELTARGREARLHAELLVETMMDRRLDHSGHEGWRLTEMLALAATGVAAGFTERLFVAGVPARIGEAVWGPMPPEGSRVRAWRPVQWLQDGAGILEYVQRYLPFAGDIVGAAIVLREGGMVVYRGEMPTEHEDRGLESYTETNLRERFEQTLTGARAVLLDLGAHGDLRLAYRLYTRDREIFFNAQPQQPWGRDLPDRVPVAFWTDFDEDITERLFGEVARASGIGPLAPGEFA
jgi:hypothetical protein